MDFWKLGGKGESMGRKLMNKNCRKFIKVLTDLDSFQKIKKISKKNQKNFREIWKTNFKNLKSF